MRYIYILQLPALFCIKLLKKGVVDDHAFRSTVILFLAPGQVVLNETFFECRIIDNCYMDFMPYLVFIAQAVR